MLTIKGNPDSDNLTVIVYRVGKEPMTEVLKARCFMIDLENEKVKFWYHINDVLHVEEHYYGKDQYRISIQ